MIQSKPEIRDYTVFGYDGDSNKNLSYDVIIILKDKYLGVLQI